MASKIKVDQIQTADGTGTIALQNQLSGLTSASMPTGSVLQVVSMNHNSETGTSSTSFIDNGLTLSITPSATSSKIYISVNQNSCRAVTNTVLAQMQLVRGSTVISLFEKECDFQTVNEIQAYGTNYLDSPSTTSAVTYKVQVRKVSGSGSFYFNSGGSNSTITLMEIAG